VIKTTIIGGSGFVGRHLFAKYRETYPDTIGTSFSRTGVGLKPFDLRQPNLRELLPAGDNGRAVLIASAKPNVGYCAQHPQESHAVNVQGTLELIHQTVQLGLQPIFLSSDYVFDGRTGAYEDDAPTNPGTEYGRQKQAVENEIPQITDNYLILRLSKIYGTVKGDGTLIDEFASSLIAGKEMRAATDQIFSPTHVDDLVNAIIAIQDKDLTGTINVCAPTAYSRYDIAVTVALALGLPTSRITAVSLNDLPGMADRPLNTSMQNSRLTTEIGQTFTALPDHIAALTVQ
jgi:dTDP-4-dehydrorhamnose reductase